jgi:plasmid stabilization system protein ParE
MFWTERAPELVQDFDRILDHPESHQVEDAPARIGEIIQGISILEHSPAIAHPVRADLRELVIGRRSTGYVAPYRYVVAIDTVFVLAIRSRRES